MFTSYNLGNFGAELKKLRKSLGYSQSDVQELVGVSMDTIRKIESGQVIPRYDTLESLSVAYKHDLLELLKHSRSSKILLELHDDVDYLITCFTKKDFFKLKKELDKIYCSKGELSVFNICELEQFRIFIEAIKDYHENLLPEQQSSKIKLINALRLTIDNFNIYKFKNYKYSYIEYRILLLLSLLIAKDKNFKLSNKILYYILENSLNKASKNNYTNFLIIKAYSNLAYNFHMLDEHQKVIELSDEGINFSLSKETIHVIHSLYYRKGIALLHLKRDDYLDSLKAACFILKLTKKQELLELYLKITKDKYGIDIPDV